MHEMFKVSKYKGKIKFDKIWVYQSGGPPQTRPKTFKLFNHLCQTHEIFRIGKYYKKIKFDKVWGYQNGGSPQTGPPKFWTFKPLTLDKSNFWSW